MGRYDLTYKADHIAIFWLSRPEAKNAVNSEVSHQMHLLQEKFEADDDLWVGIVAAVGEAEGAEVRVAARVRARERRAAAALRIPEPPTNAGVGGVPETAAASADACSFFSASNAAS